MKSLFRYVELHASKVVYVRTGTSVVIRLDRLSRAVDAWCFPALPTTGVKSMLRPGAVKPILVSSTPSLIRVGCEVEVGTGDDQGSTNNEYWSLDRLPLGSREAVTITRLFIAVVGQMASSSVEGCGCAALADNFVETDNVGCDCCGDVEHVSDELRLGGRLSKLRFAS